MTGTHHVFQNGTNGQQAVDQFKIEVVAKYTTIFWQEYSSSYLTKGHLTPWELLIPCPNRWCLLLDVIYVVTI